MRSRLVSIAALLFACAPALGQTGSTSLAPRRENPLSNAPEYGITDTTYVSIPASAFHPWHALAEFTSDDVGRGARYPTNVPVGFLAPLHLPGGAQIVYFEIDFVDTNPTQAIYAQISTCLFNGTCQGYPTAPAGPPSCALAGYLCSGTNDSNPGGFEIADLTSEDLYVDNANRHSQVYVAVNAVDGSLKIRAVRIGYRLRVSPAPATATFPNDVPTSHPFFRFVEALYAAGITQGIAPGTYGVNDPITRGQMAVFLSVALGLHWQ